MYIFFKFYSMIQKDSYKSTGCFDLTCSGFVQTSNTVALGGGINPLSTDSGTQYDLNIGIYLVITTLFSYIHCIS